MPVQGVRRSLFSFLLISRALSLCRRPRQSKTAFLQLTLSGTPVTSSHSIGPLRAKLICLRRFARNPAGMFDLMPLIAR
jgi:hypothetical protein